ncbi:MAG: Hsp20 family protein [Candidatus Dasytiphilus stammeri]
MAYRSFSLIPGITDNLFSDRFDRMDRLFSRLTGDVPLTDTPAYNLSQPDDNHYHLTISVPGYQEGELEILLQNGLLTINGKHKKNQQDLNEKKCNFLHKGISCENFSLSFNLHNRIKVQSANLEYGLLKLILEYEIPEAEKPYKIKIGQKNNHVIEQK